MSGLQNFERGYRYTTEILLGLQLSAFQLFSRYHTTPGLTTTLPFYSNLLMLYYAADFVFKITSHHRLVPKDNLYGHDRATAMVLRGSRNALLYTLNLVLHRVTIAHLLSAGLPITLGVTTAFIGAKILVDIGYDLLEKNSIDNPVNQPREAETNTHYHAKQ